MGISKTFEKHPKQTISLCIQMMKTQKAAQIQE